MVPLQHMFYIGDAAGLCNLQCQGLAAQCHHVDVYAVHVQCNIGTNGVPHEAADIVLQQLTGETQLSHAR